MREQLEDATRRGYVAAFRWLGSADESRDACQEAAVRAMAAADRFDPSRPFYPWFHRILRNLCLDRLSERRQRAPESAAPSVDETPSAEARLMDAESDRAVAAAIAALPEPLREVIELRHFQDASYAEIAEILDIPEGTVMSRLFRARRELRAAIQGQRGETA